MRAAGGSAWRLLRPQHGPAREPGTRPPARSQGPPPARPSRVRQECALHSVKTTGDSPGDDFKVSRFLVQDGVKEQVNVKWRSDLRNAEQLPGLAPASPPPVPRLPEPGPCTANAAGGQGGRPRAPRAPRAPRKRLWEGVPWDGADGTPQTHGREDREASGGCRTLQPRTRGGVASPAGGRGRHAPLASLSLLRPRVGCSLLRVRCIEGFEY